MARVCAIERAIQAWSLDVVVESLFIDPLVNIGSTLGAFEVSFGFLKMVLVWSWGRVDLGLEEVPDDLNSGQLFCWLGSLLPWVWTCTFCQLLGAGFSQAVFKLLGRETLVHACAAGGAGISTPLRCPSVVWFLPGLGALLDEVFFSSVWCVFQVAGLLWCGGSAVCPGKSSQVVVLPGGRWPCGLCQVLPASLFGDGHAEHQPAPMQSRLHLAVACRVVAHFQGHPEFWYSC